MRQDEDRLRDILDSIDAIASRVAGDRSKFDGDSMVRVWCLHHLTIVGEAVSRLSEEIRDKHPVCPWRSLIGMRNAIVHGYFDVDWEEVWNVVERDIGPLREGIVQILRSEGWES